MATEVVHVIDPDAGSGYDYDSLYDWEAAEQGDLTGARDEIAVAKCCCTGGTADTTVVTIDGWTTSATQYIKIWTDPAEAYRHEGKYPSSGNIYRMYLNGGSGVGIDNKEPYTKILGLAVHLHTYANTAIRISGSGVGWATVKDCVVKGASVATSSGIVITYEGSGAGSGSFIVNNVVYDFTAGIYRSAADQVCAIYNNTVHNCTTGFNSQGSTNFLLKNNIAQDCTTCYNSTFNSNSTNNCSDDNTQPGGSGRNGEVSFVDEANDDFHLASDDSVALGYGVNLYNDATYPFQDDIDGDDRGGSGAQWDIGADEYVSTGVNPNVSDSITLTDVVTVGNSTVPLDTSDAISVSEESSVSVIVEISTVDIVSVVDVDTVDRVENVVNIELTEDRGDSVAVNEFVSLFINQEVSIIDTLSVSESVGCEVAEPEAVPDAEINIVDTVSISEEVTAALLDLGVDTLDSTSVVDQPEIRQDDLQAAVEDSATVTDVTAPEVSAPSIEVDDSITISEYVEVFTEAEGDVNTQDSLSVVDVVTATVSEPLVVVEDGAALSEQASAEIGLQVNIYDEATVSESVEAAVSALEASVVDVVNVVEDISILRDLLVSSVDNVGISENISGYVYTEGDLSVDTYDTVTASEFISVSWQLAAGILILDVDIIIPEVNIYAMLPTLDLEMQA